MDDEQRAEAKKASNKGISKYLIIFSNFVS